jgi:hypothetical protein
MKTLLYCTALLLGQLQSSQSEDVLRLMSPHASTIPASAGGKMVELLHAPSIVRLPRPAPKSDQTSDTWYVDVKNLGPNDVTLEDNPESADTPPQFTLLLHAKDIARVRSAGSGYELVKPH